MQEEQVLVGEVVHVDMQYVQAVATAATAMAAAAAAVSALLSGHPSRKNDCICGCNCAGSRFSSKSNTSMLAEW